MKQKRYVNQRKNGLKRPGAGWLIVFAVILLLFAAFIYGGIKAGEYAERMKSAEAYDTVVYSEEVL